MDTKAFLDLFKGRTDVITTQHSTTQHRSFTEADLTRHLMGKETYEIYPIIDSNKLYTAFIDIDISNDKESKAVLDKVKIIIVKKLTDAIEKLGLNRNNVLVEFSGFKGFHIWMFFQEPMEARRARLLLKIIIVASEVQIDVDEFARQNIKINIEVMPKQDMTTDYGSSLKLPFGEHKGSKRYSYALNKNLEYIYDSQKCLEFLNTIEKVRPSEVDVVLNNHSHLVPKEEPVKSKEDCAFAPCLKKLMDMGAQKGHRNEATFEVAKHFVRQQTPQDIALAAVMSFNEKNVPPLNDAEVRATVASAYNKEYTGVGCEMDFLKSHCQDSCLIKQKEPLVATFPTLKQKANKIIDLEDLPNGFIREYVNFMHPLTEAPVQYHIATAFPFFQRQ